MLKKHGEIYYVPELEMEIQWTFKTNFKKYFRCIYFIEIDKLILKSMWLYWEGRAANTTLDKTDIEGVKWPTWYKVMVIRAVS